jgi:glycosyltransferase involved in cell wall biosynthesis
MRVLMLGWEYPPRVAGGLGAACEGLVRGLRENGVDVILVLPPGARARTLRRRGGIGSLEVVPVPGRRARGRSPDPYAPFGSARGGESLYAGDLAGAVRRYAIAAERIAGRRRFDLIHAHDWLTFPAGIAAKQASGRPLVAHVHATELDRSGALPAASPAFGIERRALPVADRVVAVSGYTAGVLRERYGVCADRVRVVHNGVDAPGLSPRGRGALRSSRGRAPVVLFVGRVTGQKGPEQFVRAAALVASERPDVHFVVAGAGDRLDAVRAEAALLRLSGRIRFTGFAARAALERLYTRADVVVMPSRSEPFGLVALEAAVRGKPVIVSRSAGVTEVLRRALRFDFGDLEELAGKILAILELPHLREAAAAGGEAEARGLSWRAAGARCAAIYRELAPAKPSDGTIAAR